MSIDPDVPRNAHDPASQNGAEPAHASPHRTRVNVVVAIVTIFLVAAGIWLAHLLADMRRIQNCVLSGRTNCAPIEATQGQ